MVLLVATFGSLAAYLAATKRSGSVRWIGGVAAGALAGLAAGIKFTGLARLALRGVLVLVHFARELRITNHEIQRKARLHALWTLIGSGTLDPAFHLKLLAHSDPAYRTWGVRAAGNFGEVSSAIRKEVAALARDPSPDVRLQAMFALTSKRQAELGERALQQVLDDPRIAQDPLRLGAVVLALQNLEAGGHSNALDRVGQRLRGLPLAEASRQTLEAILARSLPGGQTSVPAPLPR